MTPETFKSWRKTIHLSQQAAAEALGIASTYPIPRHIALACAAIAHGLEPWTPNPGADR